MGIRPDTIGSTLLRETALPDTEARLRDLLTRRIVILDGPRGTMIQRLKLSEDEFRGRDRTPRFAAHPVDLKGAKAAVTAFLDAIGFDAVDAGPLGAGGRRFQVGSSFAYPYGAMSDRGGAPAGAGAVRAALT